MDRDLTRDVLTGNLYNDLMFKRALKAIGYTDGHPLLRARHPAFDALAATSNNALGRVCAEGHTNSGIEHR